METVPIIFLLVLIGVVCYLIYDALPSKHNKIEESFEGFMNKSLARLEFEMSPLHTIVYGASNTGKTYFVKNYLILCQKDEEEHKKKMIVVCKDEKEWINPETGMPFDRFIMFGIDMITSRNLDCFENCVIVIEDMRNNLKKWYS